MAGTSGSDEEDGNEEGEDGSWGEEKMENKHKKQTGPVGRSRGAPVLRISP
ncbi:DM6 domain containing protein [Pyrenophora tritici-repentis]|uniref:DM6 domain containing protein n=1 Tax=Pyrenophora tritici-repentis TaxID=45151 RepID=A0A2W1E013_9PLEO|nr:hypothetical protein PtrV1_07562 [Pyrenophora tritici-repentis]KAF7448616.1 hypothetical protein A1F99_079800 [Pyrenophora tritici-repentis]KAF7572338.1 DM6 domain containing protein [Pyrenophora tritici-repentis]KAG9384483.1 hypothetical protein A1F94_004030 [Pyrenophora tritici-repentis]KAI0582629.1 hypothetical protein Alg215_04041 [Pyrenophora tritici-repentis]